MSIKSMLSMKTPQTSFNSITYSDRDCVCTFLMCHTTHCANIFDNFYIRDDGKFLSLMYLHKRINLMQNEYAIRIEQILA